MRASAAGPPPSEAHGPRRLLVGLALALLLTHPAVAQEGDPSADDGVDATLTLHAESGSDPTYDGPAGAFRLEDATHGRRYAWSLELAGDYTVVDVHIPDGLFDVERMQQVRPSVDVSDQHYPLFHFFPRDDVWNADGPAQVYRYVGDSDPRRGVDGGDAVLRLGLRGPVSGTFLLERDVTPPEQTLGEVRDVNHFSFYQETETDEPAVGELRIRPVGGDAFRPHPTTGFHHRQNFPVKGLDPSTTYEVEVHHHDWSGNRATSDRYQVTTTARPVGKATITPVSPPPDATRLDAGLTVRATIDVPDPGAISSVRLFIDVEQVRSGYTFDGTNLTYGPTMFDGGPHKVRVEVYDVHGNRYHEQWTFSVATDPQQRGSPPPAVGFVAAGLLVAATLSRRCRR